MKTRRFFALLLSLLLLVSIPACGDAKNDRQSGQDSGAVDPSTQEESGDFDWHDTVFPGEEVPELRFGSFENYKTFRDLVKRGGDGADKAIAFAREKLKILFTLFGDDASDRLTTAEQAEALVAEIEKVKILLPQNKDWTLSYFSREGSLDSPDGNGGYDYRFYKRCLDIAYHNDALGYISFDVYYDDATRNHTPRQFYRWGTEYGYHTDDTCKYVTLDPYFTLPLPSGETLTIFRLDDDYSDNKGFLFTDNSEITVSFDFQDDEGQLTAPTKEEKETILRDFFEGAKVVTLAEAAG